MKNIDRSSYQGTNILAQGVTVSTDSWETGLNGNILVSGASGSGKTRNFITPNLLHCVNQSFICSDTKGYLYKKLRRYLQARGYIVDRLDIQHPENSTIGFNPFDLIRYDDRTGTWSAADLETVATQVIGQMDRTEPFWDISAKNLVVSGMAYCLEALPKEDRTLSNVLKLLTQNGIEGFANMIKEWESQHPDSYAVSAYKQFDVVMDADRTRSCILAFATNKLHLFAMPEFDHLYKMARREIFSDITDAPHALFITVSDVDYSKQPFIDLFWGQAIQSLIFAADKRDDCMLPNGGCRLYLDDFGNQYIPHIDQYLSVARSRELAITIIVQSINQLTAKYGPAEAKSIISNCDTCLLLSVRDVETAGFFADFADLPRSNILNMKIGEEWVFRHGEKARQCKRYDIDSDPAYLSLEDDADETDEDVAV